VDPRVDMDDFGEKKTIAPSGIITPDHLTRGLVTTPTTLSRFV